MKGTKGYFRNYKSDQEVADQDILSQQAESSYATIFYKYVHDFQGQNMTFDNFFVFLNLSIFINRKVSVMINLPLQMKLP